jgi:hypothetical protein
MTTQNKTADMLAAIGSAVVASVVVSWTLTNFTMSRIDRELDQIHRRYGPSVHYAMPSDEADDIGEPLDVPEMPDEIEYPAEDLSEDLDALFPDLPEEPSP